MKKYKLKKHIKDKLIIFTVLIVLIILGNLLIKFIKRNNSLSYKLTEINYTKEEAKLIEEKLDDKNIEYLLSIDKNLDVIKLINNKYFINKNLKRYLKYLDVNILEQHDDVISIVNTNNDYDHYDKIYKTDTNKNELMLVNRYYKLDNKYKGDNLVNVPLEYSYEGNKLNQVTLDAFIKMHDDLKDENLHIVVSFSYRDYNSQKEIYESRKNTYGIREADLVAARAGHSEHQTGYSFDAGDFYSNDFENSEIYKWLIKNAHKYGFILRYPKDKEEITGFKYEPYHLRYVGDDVAYKIKKEKITFDEYYAYYIDNK